MKKMQTALQILIISTAFFSTSLGWAAGGASIGGGGYSGSTTEPTKRKTPQELAIQNYNQGLKYRDKAWSLTQAADAQSNEKKRSKLEKKAKKQFKKAAKRFRTAVKNEPLFYQAHGSLGYAQRKLGNYDAAVAAYDESLRLNPEYTEAIEYRAEAYLSLGRLEETRAAYLELVNMDRPRADQLMAVIQKWLQQEHVSIDPKLMAEFENWATERLTLSNQTFDLSGAAPRDWQPD